MPKKTLEVNKKDSQKTIEIKKTDSCLVISENGELELHLPKLKKSENVTNSMYIACGIGILLVGKSKKLFTLIDKAYEENIKP